MKAALAMLATISIFCSLAVFRPLSGDTESVLDGWEVEGLVKEKENVVLRERSVLSWMVLNDYAGRGRFFEWHCYVELSF